MFLDLLFKIQGFRVYANLSACCFRAYGIDFLGW